jgi:transcription initiation factor TFIIIB Brf1 subunit/transcription initiation factor TFIIB
MWEGQKHVAESVASEATRLISEAYERNPAFFGNKSKKWILGGLFYQFGQTLGCPRTQKQIARVLDTNEMTIRASYRAWLKSFPEFWTRQRALHSGIRKYPASGASQE